MAKDMAVTMDDSQVKECIANARCFLECAKKAIGYMDDSNTGVLLSPRLNVGIVNAAFSCELFLKAVGALESNNLCMKKGHGIADLFDTLAGETRLALMADFSEKYPDRFQELLDEANTAFIDWRYSHESEVRSHPYFLIELGDALDKLLKEKFSH